MTAKNTDTDTDTDIASEKDRSVPGSKQDIRPGNSGWPSKLKSFLLNEKGDNPCALELSLGVGILPVALDITPRWLLGVSIAKLRVKCLDADIRTVKLNDVILYQRRQPSVK